MEVKTGAGKQGLAGLLARPAKKLMGGGRPRPPSKDRLIRLEGPGN
jgi:hypothetical protein